MHVRMLKNRGWVSSSRNLDIWWSLCMTCTIHLLITFYESTIKDQQNDYLLIWKSNWLLGASRSNSWFISSIKSSSSASKDGFACKSELSSQWRKATLSFLSRGYCYCNNQGIRKSVLMSPLKISIIV